MVSMAQLENGITRFIDNELAPKIPADGSNGGLKRLGFLVGVTYMVHKQLPSVLKTMGAVDQNGNVLPYCSRVVSIRVEGVLELVGPENIALSGGMAGAYLKTTGVPGSSAVTLTCEGMEPVVLNFTVEV